MTASLRSCSRVPFSQQVVNRSWSLSSSTHNYTRWGLHPIFPYALWPTTRTVPKELRGDLHSPSDHQKITLFIPRCLATGGKGRADGHRQNRTKQCQSATGTSTHKKKNLDYNGILATVLETTECTFVRTYEIKRPNTLSTN